MFFVLSAIIAHVCVIPPAQRWVSPSGYGVAMMVRHRDVCSKLDPESIPRRWRLVHDCERPARWRERFSEEECALYELELDAGRTPSTDFDKVLARRRRWRQLGRLSGRRRYDQIVPQLTTTDQLLVSCERAATHDRLLAVKCYSALTSVRLAAKYRRLALKYKEECDFVAVDAVSGRAILETLEVQSVPMVLLLDAEAVRRVGECPLSSDRSINAALEHKLLSAILAMHERRALLRRLVHKRPSLVALASKMGNGSTLVRGGSQVK